MKYTLDASVALKWVLSEADSPAANKLRDDFKQGNHELLAPDTLPVEVAHALTRAERKGLIPKGQAAVLFADVVTPAPALTRTSDFCRERSKSPRIGGLASTIVSISRLPNESSAGL